MSMLESELFTWVILPILIFSARVIDVSIGTLRILYIARREKIIAPVLGFFEILIWLAAIGQIFKHLDNIACYLAYAGGFAMGNYIGMLIENRLAIGQLVVRIITDSNQDNLFEQIKSAGYGVTRVDGQGLTGPVKVLFTVIKRKELTRMIALINHSAPAAFYTVEDIQMAREAIFPQVLPHQKRYYWHLFKMDRKRK